ncbi:Zn-dependent hydrolase [Paraburkholderia caribensis]|uniref:Zn-dependent hydrolase n=1 Tax=Paraburkholderia caribensis TaxID=75105 RepID=A0A9Q6S9X0_9BURK|nr:Zn-dependent hydrolase [Paraburkholderia caribensis]AMV48569.1 Zn-dependent hydrolase [Paraburkholderia caribensis]MCO4877457.1 Zn-dependent hydrolase [Paraburkholderia caribensis]PTB29964.1 allantoate amidohydrolase [Paraburkholderia caribensis]QLB67146.1 Zn-dependent hydrolase [Paraburkholderia caribensis]
MQDFPRINPARLLDDLKALRNFGANGPGVVRLSLSPVDMDARRWLASRMTDAGLDATIDGVGTVFGRSRKSGPALVIGSHTDTQPTGGWLDGALGVIYGLEIARALDECAATRDFAVDVASWIDEEGAFSSFLGSRSFVGDAIDASLQHARNRDGLLLGDALAQAGVADVPRVMLDRTRQRAYLEPHIEQGGRLEASGKSIGVVTTIVGIREFQLRFTGQRNHAGTTPMSIRRDAGAALVAFIARIDAAFGRLADADTVWTVGRIDLDPGSFSVVPGKADMYLQFRDGNSERLHAMESALAALVDEWNLQHAVQVELIPCDGPEEPVVMDTALQQRIAQAAEAVAPGQWIHMPSGASHDAQVIAHHIPASMLFVPSIGGVSHDFIEDTSEAHIVLGCEVAARAAAGIVEALRGPV